MTRSSPAQIIVATGVVVTALYFFRGPLTQFALAMIIWLGVDGFARWFANVTRAPRPLATAFSLLVVVGMLVVAGLLVMRNVALMRVKAPLYEARLNDLLAQLYASIGLTGEIPTVASLLERFNGQALLAEAARAAQGVLSDGIFIAIYLAFIMSASASYPRKLAEMVPEPAARARVDGVLTAIGRSMETYLWVQTVLSVIITALTYATFALVGLDNALFWAFVVFLLNYIPTVGSIAAVALPTLFALVQFDTLTPVAILAGASALWQFFIGNVVQPRMMGDSLNLSALVVLLSLAIWGLIWGMAGTFLSAPLTVMLVIVCAQFPATRWIAVLLSADGQSPATAAATPAPPPPAEPR